MFLDAYSIFMCIHKYIPENEGQIPSAHDSTNNTVMRKDAKEYVCFYGVFHRVYVLMCVSEMYECVCAWKCMCKIRMSLRKGKQTHPHANGKLPQWIHKCTPAILELSKQAGRSLRRHVLFVYRI